MMTNILYTIYIYIYHVKFYFMSCVHVGRLQVIEMCLLTWVNNYSRIFLRETE